MNEWDLKPFTSVVFGQSKIMTDTEITIIIQIISTTIALTAILISYYLLSHQNSLRLEAEHDKCLQEINNFLIEYPHLYEIEFLDPNDYSSPTEIPKYPPKGNPLLVEHVYNIQKKILIHMRFNFFESLHNHYVSSRVIRFRWNIAKEDWFAWERYISYFLQFNIVQHVWDEVRGQYSEQFVIYINKKIDEIKSSPKK